MDATKTGLATLRELQDIVGDENAGEAGELDAVDGVQPRFVVAPASVEEARKVMLLAGEANLAVVPRGAGTKLSLGNPPRRAELVVDTRRLNRVVEHAAGDLVAIAQSGVTVDALQQMIGQHRQMLAVDSYRSGATIGGLIATNEVGPRRIRYGTVRDLLIGITVILPDGTVARSGGKVVKNVAGYDLGKLFTGSLGTLGLIVEATFRLHAVPPARRMVAVELSDVESLNRVLQSFLHSSLVLAALELEWENGAGRLIAVFEGVEPGVVAQADTAIDLAAPARAEVVSADLADGLWREINRLPWRYPHEVGLKVSTLPAQLSTVLEHIETQAAQRRVHVRVRGQAGASVLWVWLGGSREAIAELVPSLRERLRLLGTVVLAQAPPDMKTMDVWGEVGDAMPVMRRLKEQFDPGGVMNPGRFVGGI